MLVVFPISLGRVSNNPCTAILDKRMAFPSASWYTSDSCMIVSGGFFVVIALNLRFGEFGNSKLN